MLSGDAAVLLALLVMVITAVFSTMLAMAFRKRFVGPGVLFHMIMARSRR